MKLHHIAIWTFRLEELKEFYVRFFGGKSNEKYINPKKGFESYFVSFGEGTDLELMSRTDVQNTPIEENRVGLTHFAFTFPSQEEVLRFTEQMRSEGYIMAGEPRTSGDGYFESVVLDPDGNRIECVYQKATEGEEKTETAIGTETRTSIKTEIGTETSIERETVIESATEVGTNSEIGTNTEIESIPSVTLHTERLLLRPFEEKDAESFFACCQNPNLGNNAGWPPHRTLDESRRILHSTFINQEGIWAMILKDTQQLIGSVGIIPDPKRENPQVRMLGYWLGETYWGKGYMTEAVQGVLKYGFEKLKLSLITATCYPHNKRSQKVLKKNGFIFEGTLHQAELTYNGNIYDHQCYYLPGISQPTSEDYEEILHVWETSVRHTHDFLTEEDILFYKPLVRKHYLPAVELFVIRNASGKIVAFMGLSDELIEMLFVHPDEQGKGYGKRLVEYAKDKKQMDKVDVNEQNERALQFYLHLGFRIIGRDKTDSMGKPFPILHLQLSEANPGNRD